MTTPSNVQQAVQIAALGFVTANPAVANQPPAQVGAQVAAAVVQKRPGTRRETSDVLKARAADPAAITWGQPYCTRGWIASLMPTATFKADTFKHSGQDYIIHQNMHDGAVIGSAWLENVTGSEIKPNYLPRLWKDKVTSSNLNPGNAAGFDEEVDFSEYLRGLGANPLGKRDYGDPALLNRWRTLISRFGRHMVAAAPGSTDAFALLGADVDAAVNAPANTVYNPLD